MTGRSTWLQRHLNQKAVYWGSPVNDGHGGMSFDDPVEIDVRWEQTQVLFVDTVGQQVMSEAVVYVDRELGLGGYLLLGTLDDLASDEQSPMSVHASKRIQAVSAVPNIDATRMTRKVFLRR